MSNCIDFTSISVLAAASEVGTWNVIDAASGETVTYALGGINMHTFIRIKNLPFWFIETCFYLSENFNCKLK